MSAPRLSGRAKALVDFGPLAVFFVAYFFGGRLAPVFGRTIAAGEELFLAVQLFLPAFAIAFLYSVWKERRIAPMLLVSGLAVGVLGGLTLVFHNKTFFYMKPTIVYALFGLMLIGGRMSGRNFLKTLFDGALHLPDDAWRTLTLRYAVFFAALAVANEIAWRWLTRDCDLTAAGAICAGEKTWVNLKIWGFTAINLAFALAQAPFLAKHAKEGLGTRD
ncbi:MAG TPA: septation protein A [Parvularcula sp.]|nr:septation protein A [Parvularcula sp.]HBS32221.1 septation protein A [Parvularcula sp.]HBS35787.1 septation protein A [Parvularcula sp.]